MNQKYMTLEKSSSETKEELLRSLAKIKNVLTQVSEGRINLQEEFNSMQKYYHQQVVDMEQLSEKTGSQLKHLKEFASSIHVDGSSNVLNNLSADIGYLKGAFDGMVKTIAGIQSHLDQLMVSSNEAKTGLAVLNTGLEYTRSDFSNKLNQAAGYLQHMELSIESKIQYLKESTRLMARNLPLLNQDLPRINYELSSKDAEKYHQKAMVTYQKEKGSFSANQVRTSIDQAYHQHLEYTGDQYVAEVEALKNSTDIYTHVFVYSNNKAFYMKFMQSIVTVDDAIDRICREIKLLPGSFALLDNGNVISGASRLNHPVSILEIKFFILNSNPEHGPPLILYNPETPLISDESSSSKSHGHGASL